MYVLKYNLRIMFLIGFRKVFYYTFGGFMNMDNFVGVKVALISNGKILTILRDDKEDIPFPNMWDLPGGGREGDESPYETMSREVMEELFISIPKSSVIWEKWYDSMTSQGNFSVFMVVNVDEDLISKIIFGDEGQMFKIVSFEDFLSDENVICQLKDRFLDFLER